MRPSHYHDAKLAILLLNFFNFERDFAVKGKYHIEMYDIFGLHYRVHHQGQEYESQVHAGITVHLPGDPIAFSSPDLPCDEDQP